MNITHKTFRAVRSYLGLDQSMVEMGTGITKGYLSRIESGKVKIGPKNYDKLKMFYEYQNIEFTETSFRPKPQRDHRQLQGQQGFRIFMDDVYETAKLLGGRIEIINGSPDLFIKWLGQEWYANHSLRMEAIKDRLSVRILTGKEQSQLIARNFAVYKRVPEKNFNTQTIYIYGDKIGLFTFTDTDVFIDIFQQKDLIKTFHWMFDLVWDQAK